MPYLSLLVFAFALAAAGAGLRLARKVQKTFRHYFLSSYTAFLLVFNIVGILNLVVDDLAGAMLKDLPAESMTPVYILFGLIGLPLLALAFYLFLDFISGFLDEEVPAGFRIAYVLVWIVLGIAFLFRAQAALGGRKQPILQTLSLVSGGVIFLLPFGALAFLAVRSLRRIHAPERKDLLAFAAASATSFVLFFFAFVAIRAGTSLRLSVPVILLTANLGPLLVLRRFLVRVFPPILPGVFEGPPADRLRADHQISNRESEILALLLKGKSNKQIEEELFISSNTVRNHIHNIYKKLGVSSRLQLLNFIRSRLSSAPEG